MFNVQVGIILFLDYGGIIARWTSSLLPLGGALDINPF